MTKAVGDGTSNLAVGKRHSTAWPWRSDENVLHVWQAFIWSDLTPYGVKICMELEQWIQVLAAMTWFVLSAV
jgi:hypothetical protein